MIFEDSIVALASGRVPAGVAVVRISGPQSRFAIETISGPVPPERVASYRRLRSRDGSMLDSGLVVFFAGPNSFTGEDVAEFHLHGSRAVVAAVLNALSGMENIRHAEPGEFTRRAFLNGKLDLIEAEALADLLSAETEAQRRFAVLNTQGGQSELYLGWRRRLIHARAMIEAEVDFSDEDDVPGSVSDAVWRDVEMLIIEIDKHIGGFHAAEIIRDGFDVVILGAPNAGKSSLLNALAKREAAIVTDEPGTTRDLIEVVLDVNGMRVRLTDTAGLRDDTDKVESIGIAKALKRAKDADLVLLLAEMGNPGSVNAPIGAPSLRIGTKADIHLQDRARSSELDRFDHIISVHTGVGVADMLREIGQRATLAIGTNGDILPSRLRHVELLRESRDFLLLALEAKSGKELQAEELRLAADRLGRIVGASHVEDLLDVIFSQFCIGK